MNKSQGQTCERVLIDLRRPYWDHGTGYTALGRTQCAADTAVFVDAECTTHLADGQPRAVMASVFHPELVA